MWIALLSGNQTKANKGQRDKLINTASNINGAKKKEALRKEYESLYSVIKAQRRCPKKKWID